MGDSLTTKQKRFADAYVGEARGNANEAARIAGYARPEDQSWDVLKSPLVRAYIDERLLAESLSSAQVLRELTDIAASGWKEFLTITTDMHGELVVKMDLSNKVKSLELLGKYWKLFTDKTELTGKDGGPLRLERALAELTDAELAERAKLLLADGDPA